MLNRNFVYAAAFCAALSAPLPVVAANDMGALRAAEAQQWSQAKSQASRGSVAGDIVTWMYLVNDKTRASFPEIAAFLSTHPHWPQAQKLTRVAEDRLPDDLSTQQILNWFARTKPVSGQAMQRYMNALLQTQQTQTAVSTLKNWWVEANLSPSEQQLIISSYGQYLGTADHIRRLERMMGDKQYTAARALSSRIGNGYPELVEARVALQEGNKGVQGALNRVPRGLMKDTGLMLSRLQWRRQNNDDRGAIEILNAAPAAGKTTDPATWWKERHIMARRMIEQHNYREAYRLADAHGLPGGGADYAAAEFLAGWLALRHTGQPYKAFEHFEAMFNNVQTPISKARAAYWAGRASEALNNRDIALQWYQVAATYQTTFYGQQAAQRIGLPLNMIKGDKPPVSPAQQAAFNNRDLVQAAKLLHRAGLQSERAIFLRALLDQAQTPQDFAMLSDFEVSMGQVDQAVKTAKEAERKGLYLIDYLFPTITATVGKNDNPALIHALIRQESQFDPNAMSSAGARGLMQLMPATAKHTAKKNGVMHNVSMLTGDPSHNVKLGSLYINEMLNRYGGSMPLAIASYNAGPGRVDQWLRQFGDPRTGQIDMLDWMETIPVYETRNYVQRVLEGYTVYQAKLAKYGREHPPLRVQPLVQDVEPAAGAALKAIHVQGFNE